MNLSDIGKQIMQDSLDAAEREAHKENGRRKMKQWESCICGPFFEYLGLDNYRGFGNYWSFSLKAYGKKYGFQIVVTNATYF